MEELSENQHETEKTIEDGLMKQKSAGMLPSFGLLGNFRSSRSVILYSKKRR